MTITEKDINQDFVTCTNQIVTIIGVDAEDDLTNDQFIGRNEETIKGWEPDTWRYTKSGRKTTKQKNREFYLVKRISPETHPQYYI
jgi:hypothetical protein